MKKLLFVSSVILAACNQPSKTDNPSANTNPSKQTVPSSQPAVESSKKTIRDYYDAGNSSLNGRVDVEDITNGYMQIKDYGQDGSSYEDFVLWRWGDKDLLGSFVQDCEIGCSFGSLKFYFGGTTEDISAQVLPLSEIEKAFTEVETKFKIKPNGDVQIKDGIIYLHDFSRWYQLPRQGRTLQAGFLIQQADIPIPGEGRFIPILELEPKGDKFVIIKNHGISNFK